VYVIELGQLARRPVDGAPVSQDAELPEPGVVWGELVPAPAGDSLVPIQVGPPAGEVRLDSEERGAVHRPRVSTVEAGFFRWDLATEQVTLEPDIRRRHGLPGEGPVTLAELLARVPEEDVPSLVAVLREMMAACGTYQVEYRVMDADGMLRSMEARGRMAAGPGPDRGRACVARSRAGSCDYAESAVWPPKGSSSGSIPPVHRMFAE